MEGPRPIDAKLTIAEGLDMLDDLLDFISPQVHMKIREVVVALDRPDCLLFTPTDRGEFSLKGYLERIRTVGV